MRNIFLIVVFMVVAKFSFSLSIYPKKFEKDITKGNGENFIIINDTNERKVYKLDAIMNEEDINAKIFPKVFILNPNERKDVKVFLIPNKKIKNNIYKGNLLIQTLSMNIREKQNLKLNFHMDIYATVNKKEI
ncbi:hypothetical protein [Candidatus Cetobacterium colombiensis]|uniref:Pili assembly chaperone N-terminal domain-containing protein n=1 Tax=Candidatus Cetobacterium colombiensis TaxID=3073100 RepID=A0ABU4WDL6_9FUSO|nr:hypothetical protein [Candidatus Cetobacterium colombiensis]MDX8336593.1 hypothetical protein [Candidatus Cetobacterium colombiensis]